MKRISLPTRRSLARLGLWILGGWLALGATMVHAEVPLASRMVTVYGSDPVPAVSRMVTFQGPDPIPAASRMVSFYSAEGVTIASRMVTFYGPDPVPAVSRMVTFFGGEPVPAVSRMVSVKMLQGFDVISGYIADDLPWTLPSSPRRLTLAGRTPGVSGGTYDLHIGVVDTLGTGQAGNESDDEIYGTSRLIEPEYGVETPVLAAELPGNESDPLALRSGSAGDWGTGLYTQLATGNMVVLTTLGDLLDFAGGEAVATDPGRIAFAPVSATAFPDLLYIANGADDPAVLTRTSDGQPGSFSVSTDLVVRCLEFGAGTGFGDVMFLAGEGGGLQAVQPDGAVAPFVADLGAGALSMALSPGEYFGTYLYVLLDDGRVVRVDPAGDVEDFIVGLADPDDPSVLLPNDLSFTPSGDMLFVSDTGRRLVYAVRNDIATGVGDGRLPVALTDLAGNYPNPFNPGTMVRMELARTGPVRLDIYDIMGRHVRTLVADQSMAPGRHEIYWNGQDDRGRGVAAGVYMARLRADGLDRAVKMSLVK